MALATEIVTLAQAKTHLNLSSSTGSDTELTYFVGVASDLVESAANRVWRSTTYTDERHAGGRDAIVLLHSPVSTVTSLTDDGETISASDYVLDTATGLLRLISGSFTPGADMVKVTYTAGSDSTAVPKLAQHATLETVRHLWQTQRGTGVRAAMVGDEYAQQPTTYSLPLRAVELIDRLSLSAGIG